MRGSALPKYRRAVGAMNGNSVVHRSREMLGGEAVVRREDTETVHGKPCGDRVVRLGRTAEIAAAVQIEEDALRGTLRFDPFTGDAVYLRLGDTHGLRDPVRSRTKNLPRQTMVATIFQTALDAPLDDPHCDVRLETGHGYGALSYRAAKGYQK